LCRLAASSSRDLSSISLKSRAFWMLKTFGLVLGAARRGRFEVRLRDLLTAEPGLSRLIDPLLEARRAIIEQIAHYDRQLFTIARHHQAVARLMCRSLDQN
jgi:transposase